MKKYPKKILLTGPESTGKSTLCEALSRHYNTLWVQEYAREYLEENGLSYKEQDLLVIAQEQFQRQNQAVTQAQSYLFCDTGLEVIKVWSEYKYHRCDSWIIDHMATQHFDRVFLCDIDIPWEPDPLREYPEEVQRQAFLELYKEELQNLYGGYTLVQGSLDERLNSVIDVIEGCYEK